MELRAGPAASERRLLPVVRFRRFSVYGLPRIPLTEARRRERFQVLGYSPGFEVATQQIGDRRGPCHAQPARTTRHEEARRARLPDQGDPIGRDGSNPNPPLFEVGTRQFRDGRFEQSFDLALEGLAGRVLPIGIERFTLLVARRVSASIDTTLVGPEVVCRAVRALEESKRKVRCARLYVEDRAPRAP